jgi:hypothetical protein
MSFVLSGERDDPVNGVLSATSPLGSQLLGCNEEDEVEFEAGGVVRRVLVVRADRGQPLHEAASAFSSTDLAVGDGK